MWEAEDVLQVPLSALFRKDSGWATFLFEGGVAREVGVQTGALNDRFVQILSGLEEGDRVIVHPGDAVSDGTRVSENAEE